MLVLLLLAVGFVYVVKKYLGIDSIQTLTSIFKDLLARKQHPVSDLFQVDENSKRHGGELVAEVLKAHDVKEVFTLCGGHISPILVACESLGIRIIDTRHEVTAVFAADAVARLRQSIGVAAVTAGPGLTNTITAIKNAQMAESPLLLLGGAAPTLLKDRGALQDIDQLVLFRPLCKFTARVTRLRDIVPTLRAAIKAALSGTPGPVFIEFPIDVLYPYQTVVKEIGFVPNAKGFKKFLNGYLFLHVSQQFGGAWKPADITPLEVEYPKPKSAEIWRIADLLLSAKRPLMLLGSQATLPPVKPGKLQEIVTKLGIPVYLGGMSRGLLGAQSDIQMRQNRKEALKEADVVILAGTVCDFRLSYGRVLSSKSKVVAVNRNRSQLAKNHRVFWNSELLVQADVGSTLLELQEELERRKWAGVNSEWLSTLRDREDEKERANASKQKEVLPKLNPLQVLGDLDQALTDDAILVADGGDFVGSAAYIVRPRGPLQWLDPGAFGTLGVGGGFALGAKAVYPDRPVVILYGDGSCGYSLMEFDTFVRHKLPVVAVIGNDACWSQIARDQVPMFASSVGCDLAYTSYEKVGAALGANGLVLDVDDKDACKRRLEEAITKCKAGESSVVNVVIGRTNFREGSISV